MPQDIGPPPACQILFAGLGLSSDFGHIAARYDGGVRWLVDGYNVIRRSPELLSRERESLEAGRAALCRRLGQLAAATGDRFVVVFDGAGGGGTAAGGPLVSVVFSSARETADQVLARLARSGGAVVSNDRAVQAAARRAGALAVTADQFLARLERPRADRPGEPAAEGDKDADAPEEDPRAPRKGNPRRLSKKARAAARALRRLER
jgi:predicted RNA-binding protein with PIN domain